MVRNEHVIPQALSSFSAQAARADSEAQKAWEAFERADADLREILKVVFTFYTKERTRAIDLSEALTTIYTVDAIALRRCSPERSAQYESLLSE